MLAFLKRALTGKKLPDDLSYEKAREVLESHEEKAQRELAGRSDAEPEMLYYIAAKGPPPARRAVAKNVSTPAAANRLLADDFDEEVRVELARKIGRLLPDLLSSERERVCELTLETLDKLARDQLPRVRAMLAETIKSLDCVPKSVIDALARDVEETVCAPILEYSPLLGDGDLLEIVASARARAALSAVARRRGLSEEVSEAIVASLDTAAVAALLANPSARVREGTFEKIIDRAEKVKSWHEPLVMRSDLSLRALRRVMGFVGAALLEQISTRHDLDEATQAHLKRVLRANIDRDAESSASQEDKIQAEVLAAKESGQLDERYLEAAIEGGERERALQCFIAILNAQRNVLERIFASRSAKAITSLVWKAGMPMRLSYKMQTLLLKLHAEEILPARQGTDFPLSEEEMRWHLSYFGLEKTKG
jgi:uncharacterized protein (DUF2336 family)